MDNVYGFSRATGRSYRIDDWSERKDGKIVATDIELLDDPPDGECVEVFDTGPNVILTEEPT